MEEAIGRGAAWREFLRGLTRPSLPALSLTLLMPIGGFLFLTFGLTPAFVASNPGLLAVDPQDTDLFSISRATRLHIDGVARPSLFLIGSSTLLRSVPDPAELGREFARVSGVEAPVEHMASEGSTVVQMHGLVSLFPAHFDGVVVIEITPRTLKGAPEDEAARVVEWDPRSLRGSFFWLNKRFFLPRLFSIPRNLVNGRITYAPEPWLLTRITESGWQLTAQRMKAAIGPDYAAEREESYAALAGIVARLRGSGKVGVALLENPLTARGYAEVLGPAFWDDHRARLARFAAEQDVPVWRLDEEAGLTEEDFCDFMHLYTPASQTRYMQALARHAAELWKERS